MNVASDNYRRRPARIYFSMSFRAEFQPRKAMTARTISAPPPRPQKITTMSLDVVLTMMEQLFCRSLR